MKPNVRAAVAAIALSHASGQKVSSVYSYSDSGYINIDASVNGNRVEGYDYSNGCHVDGNLPGLYHYGEGSHLDFNAKPGGKYDGYDYSSGSHFEVSVNGNSAEVYDFGASGFFSYST